MLLGKTGQISWLRRGDYSHGIFGSRTQLVLKIRRLRAVGTMLTLGYDQFS